MSGRRNLSSQATVTPKPGQPSPPATPGPCAGSSALVNAARRDLAERLGIAEEVIKLRSSASVEWPDASLGCPQPDMMYAQVITPGYRIVLETEGQAYTYHAAQSHVVLCGSGR